MLDLQIAGGSDGDGDGGGGGGTIIQWRMARSNKMFFTAKAVMHGGARGHFPMNK